MSQVSTAHYELARYIRWHAKQHACDFPGLDYEVDGAVQHYHRQDGYREVKVVARNRRYLQELKRIIDAQVEEKSYKARINTEINGSARHPSEHILSLSIWP